MSDSILILTEARVMTLRINRPDKKNALTQGMYTALAEALTAAAGDSAVRAVVITGTADCFSSGNDLADFMAGPAGGTDSPVLRFMNALEAFPKPVIAAVTGLAIGIGTTLLLHADLVYAGESTRFQMPFVNIGICPEFSSTYLLPRFMGHVRAAELLLFGDFFTAKTALEFGMINAVLPDGEVLAKATDVARRLAEKPPQAIRTTKELMRRWSRATVKESIQIEAEHFVPMLRQPEAVEAISAFMQKRKPDFSKFE